MIYRMFQWKQWDILKTKRLTKNVFDISCMIIWRGANNDKINFKKIDFLRSYGYHFLNGIIW